MKVAALLQHPQLECFVNEHAKNGNNFESFIDSFFNAPSIEHDLIFYATKVVNLKDFK
jgi:hypothetical protein